MKKYYVVMCLVYWDAVGEMQSALVDKIFDDATKASQYCDSKKKSEKKNEYFYVMEVTQDGI